MTLLTGSRGALFVAVFAVVAAAGCTPEPAGVTAPSAPAPSAPAPSAPAPSAPAIAVSAQPSASRGPSVPAGWQTVEHQGVRAEVPGDWVRAETEECEAPSVRWQPAEAPDCRFTTGVAFYLEATFDPAFGPGIHQGKDNTWSGYVFAGDYAVYAVAADRDLVQAVLDTARPRVRR
ncbi:hypothetical protein Q0Z83_007880 [Actinoplanes sichuanensis]|uniref:Secreted protein n=1 Tax=Actinoplanes sichuanensis TaxID=512349 RepID=A0ABW4AF87_9ACTN|nr:hypothetical protein [Actinoplanes sichuanensis]BEL02597.1 hypothetical protein Q0Z83_007880 [Actinoplanes sichuanensis]